MVKYQPRSPERRVYVSCQQRTLGTGLGSDKYCSVFSRVLADLPNAKIEMVFKKSSSLYIVSGVRSGCFGVESIH